eukprot:snap_masked-scaffold_45-processed-gene-1.48-mRNA-1 protein AED:1.00 eAED:1.00 QI:0/-1/0/0/-1/1/1/0/335
MNEKTAKQENKMNDVELYLKDYKILIDMEVFYLLDMNIAEPWSTSEITSYSQLEETDLKQIRELVVTIKKPNKQVIKMIQILVNNTIHINSATINLQNHKENKEFLYSLLRSLSKTQLNFNALRISKGFDINFNILKLLNKLNNLIYVISDIWILFERDRSICEEGTFTDMITSFSTEKDFGDKEINYFKISRILNLKNLVNLRLRFRESNAAIKYLIKFSSSVYLQNSLEYVNFDFSEKLCKDIFNTNILSKLINNSRKLKKVEVFFSLTKYNSFGGFKLLFHSIVTYNKLKTVMLRDSVNINFSSGVSSERSKLFQFIKNAGTTCNKISVEYE